MADILSLSRRVPRAASALIAVALIAASCSRNADPAPEAGSSTSQDTSTTTVATTEPDAGEESAEPAPVEALSGLDGAIGEASDLALSWFNGAPFDETVYLESFDDAFRSAVPFGGITPVLDQLVLDAPITVREIQEARDTEAQLIIIGSSGTPALLAVAVVGPDDATITGLFVGPADQPIFDAPTSVDDAIARLQALGTVRMASLNSDCTAGDLAIAADEQAPLGSIFKLWVLAAVAVEVDAGTLSWDDQVEIRDELDSIPSGITQNEAPGTMLTVRELATRMIEISDNTATDHLIDRVGRPAVEQAMIDSGHLDPARNLPLMSTREFTIVKFTSDELRARYLAADEAERRTILEDAASMPLPPLSNITTVTDPIEVEMLEWFASPIDLCRVLIELSDNDEAAAILAMNPGMPDVDNRWADILYKGGSEPGVFAMAWLTIADDGTRSVFAASIANEDALIDEFEAANLLGFVRDAR